jgi:hypothetical protein
VLTHNGFTRASLLGGVILVATTALHPQSKSNAEFRPKIPKAWEDAEVATMELPLAPPAPRTTNIPESYYYSIPPVTIYKSYPLVSAGKPFAEYMDWLKQQEPEVAFDPAKLKTKADWEIAGELVFSFSLAGYSAIPQSFLDAGAQGKNPPAPPFFTRIFIREKGKLETNTGSAGGLFLSALGGGPGKPFPCSGCHGQFTVKGNQIDGVQPNRPGGPYPGPGIAGATADQRRQSMLFWYGTPWFNPDPNVDGDLTRAAVQPWNHSLAVFDREGSSLRSPLQIPVLIGLKDRKYFDHTGLHLHRSIADLMRYAVLASGIEALRKYGDFIPGGDNDHKNLPAPTRLLRFTDEQLYALALYIYSLDYPLNPNRSDSLSAKGETIFKREGCVDCHTPPLYTNNKLIPVDGFVVPPEHKKLYDILEVRIGLDPYLATKTRRGTGYYKVPSLRGVWMRSALEHNGSVASLEDWFDPNRLKDTYVPTGFRGPDLNRAVKGHPFGLQLSTEEKKALLAFLRTL